MSLDNRTLRHQASKLRYLLAAGLIFLLFFMLIKATMPHIDPLGMNENQLNRFVTTMVETHSTGLFVEKTMNPLPDSLLPTKTTLKLYRNVGDWQVIAGDVTAEKLVTGKIGYSFNLTSKYVNGFRQFEFSVPSDLLQMQLQPTIEGSKEAVWDQIQHIEDGYVAEMAFSTSIGMDPEQLLQRIKKYDLHLLQMPVYAGELTTIQNMSHWSTGSMQFVPHLSIRPYLKYTDNNLPSIGLAWIDSETHVRDSIEQLTLDMNWLIDNGDYYDKEIDKQRMKYLSTHGYKVYGAVVTGPIRELEKLKQESDFYQFQLGQIEVWNWKSSSR